MNNLVLLSYVRHTIVFIKQTKPLIFVKKKKKSSEIKSIMHLSAVDFNVSERVSFVISTKININRRASCNDLISETDTNSRRIKSCP